MARSRKSTGWFTPSRLKLLVVLLSGGGAGLGGWQYRDSLLAQFVQKAEDGEFSGDDALVGVLKSKVHDVLESYQSFSTEGRFEVRIEELALDSGLFKPGQTIDLQVYVTKLDLRGKKTLVWNSQTVDRRLVRVGNSPIATSWQVSPFEVDWVPGDRMVVEVWDHKALFSTKLFELSELIEAPSKPVFPLKTGAHSLSFVPKHDKNYDTAVNQVVLRSRRVESPTDVEGDHNADSAGPTAQRDSDTIIIK